MEVGEGAGERAGARLRTLSIVCQGILANPGIPPRNQRTFRPKGLKKQFAGESATASLREGTWEQATLEQHWLGHAWGQLNPDQNRSLK